MSRRSSPLLTRGGSLGSGLLVAALFGGLLAVGLIGGPTSSPSVPTPAPTTSPTSGGLVPSAIADVHPPDSPFAPDATTIASCAVSDTECLIQGYANLAYADGPKAAIATLAAETREPVIFACHQISHRIGAAAIAANGDRAGAAFVAGNSTCASGYYHGVLQHAFLGVDLGNLDEIGRRAGKICTDPQIQATGYLAFQCGHGLGHGLLIATGYDLPMALEACGALPNALEREWCASGVHMENFTPSYGRQTAWVDAVDFRYPCTVLRPDQGKASCYNLVAIRAIEGSNQRWEAVADACARAEADYAATCFEGMGLQVQGRIRGPQEALDVCAIAGVAAQRCVDGVALSFVNRDANGREALRVCALVADPAAREACSTSVGSALRTVVTTPAAAVALCDDSLLPETASERDACRRGADR